MAERRAHIWRAFCSTAWCLDEAKFIEVRDFLVRWRAGKLSDADFPEFDDDDEPRVPRDPENLPAYVDSIEDDVAVMRLHGTLARRMNLMTRFSGGTSLEIFGQSLDRLVEDSSVRSIVISVDSGGGEYTGLPELGDRIYAASQRKRVIALADDHALSAAYWLLSQARECYVTQSGQVGSIGVYWLHINEGAAMKDAGLEPVILRVPDAKKRPADFERLDAATRDHVMESLGRTHDEFVRVVVRGRRVSEETVRESFGGGRIVDSQIAVDAGMVDGISDLSTLVGQEIESIMADKSQDERIRELEQERDAANARADAASTRATEVETRAATATANAATEKARADAAEARIAAANEATALTACEDQVRALKNSGLDPKEHGQLLRSLQKSDPKQAESLLASWKAMDARVGANLTPAGSTADPANPTALTPSASGARADEAGLEPAQILDKRVAARVAEGKHRTEGRTDAEIEAEIAQQLLSEDEDLAEKVADAANTDYNGEYVSVL